MDLDSVAFSVIPKTAIMKRKIQGIAMLNPGRVVLVKRPVSFEMPRPNLKSSQMIVSSCFGRCCFVIK